MIAATSLCKNLCICAIFKGRDHKSAGRDSLKKTCFSMSHTCMCTSQRVSRDRLGAGVVAGRTVERAGVPGGGVPNEVAPGVLVDLSVIRVASVSYAGLTRIRYDTMCVGCGPRSWLLWWQDAGDDDDEDDDIIPGRQGTGYGSSM